MHRRATLTSSPRYSQTLLSTVGRTSQHIRLRHQAAHTFNKKSPLRVSLEEYKTWKRASYKIVERAAVPSPGWWNTPTLRGREKRLDKLVKNPNPSTAQRISQEKEGFEDENDPQFDDTLNLEARSAAYPPGTFVETIRNQTLSHGVVLGEVIFGGRRKMRTLVSTGEVWFAGRQDVLYTFHNFVPDDLLARCGEGLAALTPTENNARVEVLRRIQEIERKVEVQANIVAQKSIDIYDRVKPIDPDAWSSITTQAMSHLISRNPDEMTLFALHKYLFANSLYFVAHQSYDTTQMMYIRPQSHIDNINTIKGWTRRPDSPIRAFARKAKDIITVNDRIQESTRTEGPSYGPATHVWTDADLAILEFLCNSLRQTRSTQADPYALGVSYILRQIYPTRKVENDTAHQVLVKLGVLAPWQDLTSLDPAIDLDTEPVTTSTLIKRRQAIAARSFASMTLSGTNVPIGPEDFHKTDPLESIRHDFGNLPVFVIDDFSAQELDDGVSIERIPSDPHSFWVHAHIADPASLLPRTHVLAQEAARTGATTYFTHRSWPLFPKELMSHPVHGLSLGPKLDGSPTKVLTFSSRVDDQGNLVEYKVRAGLIRNINVITYDEVDAALGWSSDTWYPFGHVPQPSRPLRGISEPHTQDLRDLKLVADRVTNKRFREGIITASSNRATLTPIIYPPPELNGPIYKPTTFRGFPTFQYSVMKGEDLEANSHLLVSEMMKLASRVASLFCTEHGLPIMRRVSDPKSLVMSPEDKDTVLAMRSFNTHVPRYAVADKLMAPPTTGFSMEPKAHYQLGVADGEGYTYVTSPLRRYLDLVAHWQIHHALLGSAAPQTSPPFDMDELQQILKHAAGLDTLARIASRSHDLYWVSMFIHQWAQVNGNDESPSNPFNNLKGYLISKPHANRLEMTHEVNVDIPYLGIVGNLTGLPTPRTEADLLPPTTEVELKLNRVILGTRPQISFTHKI